MSVPLELIDLHKYYGPVHAVQGVNLKLEEGEIFGLLGPNGAGKTSIISCINTLESPTSGQIKIFGYDVEAQSRDTKVRLGCVPQEVINHGYFSVEEILHFHSGFYGLRKNNARIDELLHELKLSDHRHKKVKQLSGGMKRRLMIAKALLHQPRLLLLDEPTAGVDIELRANLWEYVKKLQREGTTILLTTHYLEEAERLCGRVAVISQGRLVALDYTKNLVQKHGKLEEAVRHLLSEKERAAL